MKIAIDTTCGEKTCGQCGHKEQHSNVYPEEYRCNIFNQWLQLESGDCKSGLSFYRLEECLQAGVSCEL